MLLDDLQDEETLKAKKVEKLDLIEFSLLIMTLGTLGVVLYLSMIGFSEIDYLSVLGYSLFAIPPLMCISKFRAYRKDNKTKWTVAWAAFGATGTGLMIGMMILLLMFLNDFGQGINLMEGLMIFGFIGYCIFYIWYCLYIIRTINAAEQK
ncbi:MAG: hypothetical protein GY810_01285 [Aureispira sp.]|nr:hypothetical protein [Aureispira sp.]